MERNRVAPEMTVAEAYDRYADEWVLLHITHPDGDYRKERGRVLAHARDREALAEAYRVFRAAHPSERTFEFFAGEAVPEGIVVVL